MDVDAGRVSFLPPGYVETWPDLYAHTAGIALLQYIFLFLFFFNFENQLRACVSLNCEVAVRLTIDALQSK